MDDHMKAVANRLVDTVKKKGTAYTMKYLIHVVGWSENEAMQIVRYALKKGNPPEADGNPNEN